MNDNCDTSTNSLEINLDGADPFPGEMVCKLREVLCLAAQKTGLSGGSVNISFISDDEISVLNEQFKNHEGPTDVLSFPMQEVNPETGRMEIGDIAVSLDTAKRQAAELNTSWEVEALLYALHGFLHLGGYDDQVEADREVMWTKQRELMSQIGFEIS